MKKRYLGIGLGVFLLAAAASGGQTKQSTPAANVLPKVSSAQTTTAASTSQDATVTPASPAPTTSSTSAPQPSSQTPSGTNLSNNNTYTNVDGNTVHSPAYSENGSVPAGATARCIDGTYSFSQNHRGTCSYHGGVSSWL